MIKYMAIDPGETSGVAAFDEEGNLKWLLDVKFDVIDDFCEKYLFSNATGLKTLIIEEYRVYPDKAKRHAYSDLKTARAIGAFERAAKQIGVHVCKQQATIMNTGYKYLGRRRPHKSDPTRHMQDATAHGTYWLVENRILNPAKLLRKK